MLDLIIPVYKNIKGLYRTLMSIGFDYNPEVFQVTIVDDASGDDYSNVISAFEKIFPIRVLRLKENRGPGIARQYGLDHTNDNYVMFIDCGDTFSTPTTLPEMLEEVANNPEIVFFSWAHTEEHPDGSSSICVPTHNRMHGKIYKREFINKNNIRFTERSSRADEDIGFNVNCRLHARQLAKDCGHDTIYHNEQPAVMWKWSGPSIVRANNCAFYYQKQTMGVGITIGEAIDNAIAHGVDFDLIRDEIYDTMSSIYIFYLSMLNRRPEFIDESLAGCDYFYQNYFKKIPKERHDTEALKNIWYNTLNWELNDENSPLRDKMIAFDILGWLNMLEERNA